MSIRKRIEKELNERPGEYLLLALAALFFVLVFAVFFPPYFVSSDEHGYVTNAALLAHGTLTQESNQYYCELHPKPNGFASTYPLGKSVLLVGLIPFGMDALFWSGAFVHLLNFFLFILILKRLRIHGGWALAYLFFPAFQWSARTLSPELSVLTFFLLAYYAWLDSTKHAATAAGFFLGVALFFRTDAFLGFGAFVAQAFFQERSRLPAIVAGFLVPGGGWIALNLLAYGSFLPQAGNASSLLGQTPFLALIPEFFTFLALLLFLTPPLSVWAIRHESRHRILFGALIFLTSLFFVRFYSFWSLGISIPHILTVRLRYFIPAIGLLLIPAVHYYAAAWSQRIRPFLHSRIPGAASPNALRAGVMLLLITMGGATVLLHSTHQDLLNSRHAALSAVHSLVPVGATVVGSADDCIYFLPEWFGPIKYIRVDALPPDFKLDESVYVLDISYSSQRGTGTSRQDIIDRERQQVQAYIVAHADQLEKKLEIKKDTYVTIWQGKMI